MSNLISRVEPEDAKKMLTEIENVNDLFEYHYKGQPAYKGSALEKGKSVWLHQGNPKEEFFHEDRLPFTISYIKKILNLLPSDLIGRAYIYKLGPGLDIFEHVDRQDYYYKTKRYHIYFDIPLNTEIKHNGPTIEPYTTIFFDPIEPHAYANNSNQTLTFIVFDTYNK